MPIPAGRAEMAIQAMLPAVWSPSGSPTNMALMQTVPPAKNHFSCSRSAPVALR
jgi:hypothetical protein